ncbi:MAG TPA: DUF4214 domain-containing protein [Acidimicrobiales bacterium]|nr:DUF4214 domain-containing protein [Acidimicrobiales bacterium]
MAKALVAGGVALVLLPVASTTVGAAQAPPGSGQPRVAEPFELSMVEGELRIRDAEEPLALEQPTTLTGSYDTGDEGTGAISGATFSTPVVSFETEAQGFPVFVDAAFSQVTPGSGTGGIDPDGNVVLNTALTATLDIEVGSPPLIVAECRTTPVNVTLDSVAPYDEVTDRVTLADANFTVPAAPVTPDCPPIVADGINEQLAGSGHSLTLTMEGELMPPEPPGCPSLTDLAAAPPASTLGTAVNLTATVVMDPAFADDELCEDAIGVTPGGFVEFRDGNQVLGTAELNGSGVAAFSVADLPAGVRNLTARYRGLDPYSPSTSDVVTHRVSAPPAIVSDIPENLQIGGPPVEFDVTVTNTGFGSDVINGRLDLAFRRVTGGGNNVGPPNFTLEYLDGVTWVPVVMSGASDAFAAISPSTGAPLPVGESFTRRVRLTVKPTANPAAMNVTFMLTQVDPVTGLPAPTLNPSAATVAQSVVRTHLVNVPRRTTAVNVSGLRPHTVRQGQTVRVHGITTTPGTVNGLRPSGTFEVLLDGVPVPVRTDATVPELGYQPTVPAGINTQNAEFVVPINGATGTRTITVRYSGDRFFLPAQWTNTISVLASRGVTYTCKEVTPFFTDRFTVNVEANVSLPSAVASGTEVDLDQLDVTLYTDRGNSVDAFGVFFSASNPVLPPGSTDPGIRSMDFGFSGGGGTSTSVTFANSTLMTDATRPVDPNPDQVVGFEGETGSVTIEGAPGEVVPVSLEAVGLTAFIGGDLSVDCTPLGGALVLGQVTVAGTTLTVEAPDPTRAGDEVTLNASVAPVGAVGTVEFRDGTETIGVRQLGTGGTASMITDSLEAGTHTLTARFFGNLGSISTTSEPVELVVLTEFDCQPFAIEGDGAVVRLVYIELLHRCPDQAGFDYWVGRLAGGTSPEAFAAAISNTDEAQGRLVAKAYQMMLGRDPEAAGQAYWVGRLQGGDRYDHLLAALAGEDEFWVQAGSTNEGFVTRLYDRVLERAPDAEGLAYWVARLEAGRNRGQVARSFTTQVEPRERLVIGAYQEILDRPPSPAELADATDELGINGDLAALYAQLIGTPEFDTRAQGFPTF